MINLICYFFYLLCAENWYAYTIKYAVNHGRAWKAPLLGESVYFSEILELVWCSKTPPVGFADSPLGEGADWFDSRFLVGHWSEFSTSSVGVADTFPS